MRSLVLAFCFVTAGIAVADDAERIDVAVGETVERDVGYAMGLMCDDITIVHADVRAKSPESNTFTVTGVKEGTTLCRVGTAPNRPSILFDVHVIAQRPQR